MPLGSCDLLGHVGIIVESYRNLKLDAAYGCMFRGRSPVNSCLENKNLNPSLCRTLGLPGNRNGNIKINNESSPVGNGLNFEIVVFIYNCGRNLLVAASRGLNALNNLKQRI